MAITHPGIEGRSNLYKVNPDAVLIREGHNPRKLFEIEDLKQSILSQGLLKPITVEKEGQNLYLVDGERRLRAIREARAEGHDITTILADITTKKMDRKERLITALIANNGEPLTPMEEAQAFSELREQNMSAQDIAKSIGKSKVHVYGRLKLLDLTPEVQEAVLNKEIGVKQAIAISKEYKDDPTAQLQAMDEAKAEFEENKLKKEEGRKATLEAKAQGQQTEAQQEPEAQQTPPQQQPEIQQQPQQPERSTPPQRQKKISSHEEDMHELLRQNVDELIRLRNTADDHDLEMFTQGVIRGLCLILDVEEPVRLDY